VRVTASLGERYGVGERLSCVVGVAEELPFESGSFDAVYAGGTVWGDRYLTEEIGVTFHRDPIRMSLAGHRCFLAHGDGLGRGDMGYRLLRWLLRGRATRFAFRWLHPDVGATIARRVSKTELRHDALDPKAEARSRALQGWARDLLLADEELDVVILGHTHIPRRVEVAPGRFYVNSGDWLQNGSYVVLEEGKPPRLETWSGSAPPEQSARRAPGLEG
jgi:UDP-2,3-diacylglucosamine hydrolase